MVRGTTAYFFYLFLLIPVTSCSKENLSVPVSPVRVTQSPPVSGSRIAWDYTTLKQISPAGSGTGYNGYARVIQLNNKSLLCVYESGGNIVAVKSKDTGASWTAPVIIAAKEEGINMAVPDILQLQDKSILVAYNPRPFDIDPSRRFAIRTKKSYDLGLTWKDERVLYEAGYRFHNGCWEPSAIQLPDGEIQLFFANEGIYTSSKEQNISLLRSNDGGLTWTEKPEIVSFRAGSRDGMPIPLLLQDKNELIVAIEDNGYFNFKPYTIRSTVENDWSTIVSGGSDRRSYALEYKINDKEYAGAPYLDQLSTGETILSYQGTEGRPSNNLGNADMKVTIGSDEGYNFNRKTAPFIIPGNKSCLWNSIGVFEGDTIIALTSTNAYSHNGSTDVWMIKGYLIPELRAKNSTIKIDGVQDDPEWQKFQIFVGHQGLTQLRSNITYDDTFLYILNEINDNHVVNNPSLDPENGDGVTIYLDVENKSYEKPDEGIFSIFLSADKKLIIKEGNDDSWRILNDHKALKFFSKSIDSGYIQELAIPWSLVGDKPELNQRVGFSIRLTESSGKAEPDYRENLSSNKGNEPHTWMTLLLE